MEKSEGIVLLALSFPIPGYRKEEQQEQFPEEDAGNEDRLELEQIFARKAGTRVSNEVHQIFDCWCFN